MISWSYDTYTLRYRHAYTHTTYHMCIFVHLCFYAYINIHVYTSFFILPWMQCIHIYMLIYIWGWKSYEVVESGKDCLTLALFLSYFKCQTLYLCKWPFKKVGNIDAYIHYWKVYCDFAKVAYICIGSVQFSRSIVSDSLWPHESQHARLPCPSQTPGVHSDSCPSSQWCHPAISSSVVPFSSCPQSFPASGSFQMSQLFAWGGQYKCAIISKWIFLDVRNWKLIFKKALEI